MRSRTRRTGPARRPGAVAPLTALLLVFLMALVAFAIDIGYLVLVQGELESAADATALAGASQIFDRDELRGAPNQSDEMAAVRAEAVKFAQKNRAGGVNLLLDRNESNDLQGDIVAGYLANPKDYGSTLQFNSGNPPTPFSPPLLFWLPPVTNPQIPFITPPSVNTTYQSYNSVQTRVQRSAARNGSLRLFFAPVLGHSTFDLAATATATYEDNIKGFKIYPNGPPNSKLLPFAMDVNTYGAIASGLSGFDLWSYDAPLPPPPRGPAYADRVHFVDLLNFNTILSNPKLNPRNAAFLPQTVINDPLFLLPGGDRIKEALLVPLTVPGAPPNGLPAVTVGNFGTLYLGKVKKNDFATFQRQVRDGPNKKDFTDMGGTLELGANGTLVVKGDTGIDAALKELLLSIKGEPRVIPLFRTTATGPLPQLPGNDADYTLVGFGGIVILEELEIPGTPAINNPLTGAVIDPAGDKALKLFVQPEFVIDGTAIGGGSVLNNGGARTSRFVYRPLALSR
jgi:hypothetical protein